jgi:hypothetical protein
MTIQLFKITLQKLKLDNQSRIRNKKLFVQFIDYTKKKENKKN